MANMGDLLDHLAGRGHFDQLCAGEPTRMLAVGHPMPATRDPISPKITKTAEELEAALVKALRAYPECQGVSVAKLIPLDGGSGLANWDAEFVAAPGAVMSSECRRASISAKHAVQKRFNLAGAQSVSA